MHHLTLTQKQGISSFAALSYDSPDPELIPSMARTGFICNVRTRNLTNRQVNRIMNRENIKIFFSPALFKGNYFVRKRERGIVKV